MWLQMTVGCPPPTPAFWKLKKFPWEGTQERP